MKNLKKVQGAKALTSREQKEVNGGRPGGIGIVCIDPPNDPRFNNGCPMYMWFDLDRGGVCCMRGGNFGPDIAVQF